MRQEKELSPHIERIVVEKGGRVCGGKNWGVACLARMDATGKKEEIKTFLIQ